MLDYAFIFLILLLGGCISLISTESARARAFVVYLFTALPGIWLFATLRASHVDHDYQNYVEWFETLGNDTLETHLLARDPTFALIGLGVHLFGWGVPALMGTYAALSLAGQTIFAKRLFPSRWLPLGLFLILCRFFIPHEMTQIRAGVAIPLASLAILLFDSRRLWQASLLFAIAAFFHASVLLMLPVIVIIVFRISLRSRLWGGVLLALAFAGKVLFSHAALLLVAWSRIGVYVSGEYQTEGIRLLSAYVLFRAIPLLILFTFFWGKLTELHRRVVFCCAMGLFLQIAFSANDSIAIRTAEIFGLFDISVALLLFTFLKPRAALVYAFCLLVVGGLFFRSATAILESYRTVLTSLE